MFEVIGEKHIGCFTHEEKNYDVYLRRERWRTRDRDTLVLKTTEKGYFCGNIGIVIKSVRGSKLQRALLNYLLENNRVIVQ